MFSRFRVSIRQSSVNNVGRSLNRLTALAGLKRASKKAGMELCVTKGGRKGQNERVDGHKTERLFRAGKRDYRCKVPI